MWLCFSLFVLTSGSRPDPVFRKIVKVIPSSGRVVERYSKGFLDLLDEETLVRLDAQDGFDQLNDALAPVTNNTVTETTNLGTITLGSIFSKGPTSVLFEIVEYPHLLIKYQVNCDMEEIHPLLREAWYGGAASEHGLAPSVLFVSPAVRLGPTAIGKCLTTMPDAEYARCLDTIGTLRYMIFEKVGGMDLDRFRRRHFSRGNMGLRNAVAVGSALIQELEKLHNVGIVHGDIYASNVMLIGVDRGRSSTDSSIRLIDFGKAFPVQSKPLPTHPIYMKEAWFHELCTPWQIDGFAWARRDDVMKAVYTMIELMHPLSFQSYMSSLINAGYKTLMTWKQSGRMYVTEHHDPVKALPIGAAAKEMIYANLDTVLTITRNLDINEPIPYGLLIASLEAIISIIDGRSTSPLPELFGPNTTTTSAP